MKKFTSLRGILSLCLIVAISLSLSSQLLLSSHADALTGSDWRAGEIIDDGIFYRGGDMSPMQIQQFLNAKVPTCDTWGAKTSEYGGGTRAQYGASRGYPAPYICLKDYFENPNNHDNNLTVTAGVLKTAPFGSISAAQIIYNASVTYNISARALLVLLQKESAGPLPVDDWPFPSQYRNAMGYGCPDTAPCDASYAGLYNQISNAARQFTVYKNYPSSFRHIANRDNNVLYNPSSSCGSSSVYIKNYATAGLYNYTPYQPNAAALNNLYGIGDGCSAYGNRNFWRIFSDWFGTPTSPCGIGTNNPSLPSGSQVLSYKLTVSSLTSLAYVQNNNTGSACTEAHIWNSSYQTWAANYATGMPAIDPAGGKLLSYSPSKGAASNLIYLLYSGGGGLVEAHKISPDLKGFPGYYDVATNLSGVTAATGTFVAGDFLGAGYDQMAYVLYSGSTGKVEVHLFNKELTKAIGYYDVATNLSGVTAATGTFVAGDFLGAGYDQMAYVLYSGSTGKVEVHLFNKELTKAIGYYDVATNLSGVTAATGTFVAGDFLGAGYDQMAYVLYSGSTGKVEVHLFNKELTKAIGYYDVATNLSGVTAATGTFVAGDFLGRGYDQLSYISYAGSSGKVESHMFNKALTSAIGFQDIATNLPGFDPTK